MPRRLSIFALATRALTALMTVWCLGCSAYEPLMDGLLGAQSSVMTCASEMSAPSQPSSDSSSTMSASPSSAAHAGYACGCESCQSASPQGSAIVIASAAPPTLEVPPVIELASLTRAPVAPPPESRTL